MGAPKPFATQVIVDLLSDQASTAQGMLYSVLTLPIYAFTEMVAALVGVFGGQERRAQVHSWVYGAYG